MAVLPCAEIDAVSLRRLAWELEKTGTDLCVAPSLLDVAGPRTTIRPTAGLTLLHVDHPQLSGARQVLKGLFDRCGDRRPGAAPPLLLAFAAAIKLSDRGPRSSPRRGSASTARSSGLQVPHDGGGR